MNNLIPIRREQCIQESFSTVLIGVLIPDHQISLHVHQVPLLLPVLEGMLTDVVLVGDVDGHIHRTHNHLEQVVKRVQIVYLDLLLR